MKIGLTFFLRKGERSIWSSGADQQCIFLWMLLQRCHGVEKVYAINAGDGDTPQRGLMLGGLDIEFVRLHEIIDELDVLIEAGGQVEAEACARVRANGGRVIAYKFGNSFVIDAERIIHNKSSGSIFNGSVFDEVWTNEQHMATCASHWRVCYRAPVRSLPHLWCPHFIDKAIAELPPFLPFGYKQPDGQRRVVIFEPNINIVKTCFVPMLACEAAYRRRPDLIGDVYVTNAEHLKEHITFRKFASNLDIVKAGKMSFEARHKTPWMLARYADVVVSHQWENGLNFLYYEALYGGYPLVHNSDLLPDGIGFRYEGFDAEHAGDALIRAAQSCLDTEAAAKFIGSLSPTHWSNVARYEEALLGAGEQRLSA